MNLIYLSLIGECRTRDLVVASEFNTRLRQTFFPAYFRLSTLPKHVRKVGDGFGKKAVLVLV